MSSHDKNHQNQLNSRFLIAVGTTIAYVLCLIFAVALAAFMFVLMLAANLYLIGLRAQYIAGGPTRFIGGDKNDRDLFLHAMLTGVILADITAISFYISVPFIFWYLLTSFLNQYMNYNSAANFAIAIMITTVLLTTTIYRYFSQKKLPKKRSNTP